MEIHQVLSSVTLIGKLKKWKDSEQVILSAFIQCLREFDVISVLNGFNCSIEREAFDSQGLLEEMVIWIQLQGSYICLILREVTEDSYVVSDR